MISKGTNNKQQNQTAIPCDAGSVVMGRTADNGEYKILKLDSTGAITSSNTSFVAGGNYSNNPTPTIIPVGPKPVDTLLTFVPIASIPLVQGIYQIAPFVILNSTTTPLPNVDILLVRKNSTLFNYINTLTIGSSVFLPTIANLQNGLIDSWTNNLVQNISTIGNIQVLESRISLQKNVYLDTEEYYFAVLSNSNFSLLNGEIFTSCSLLAKL
jgi:hypothetical protein